MILIVFLIALLIVIIILKVKAKFRHFIGDADAFQRLALYTSCLQKKCKSRVAFMYYYLGEFWQGNVQKILSLCQMQHFAHVFVLVGNTRAPCPAPCLELATQLGTRRTCSRSPKPITNPHY